MIYNWWAFGTPFTGSGEWNNFPLWMATLPCLGIADVLHHNNPLLQEHPYALVILYTLICLALYALVGFLVGLLIQTCVAAIKHRKPTA